MTIKVPDVRDIKMKTCSSFFLDYVDINTTTKAKRELKRYPRYKKAIDTI